MRTWKRCASRSKSKAKAGRRCRRACTFTCCWSATSRGSTRRIAWRCSDSLSLRKFLGIPLGEDSPDHSSLSYIRNRLPLEVHRDVFVWILTLAERKKLLQGKTVALDSTTLEANAAMKSIIRRDTGEDWNK